ncbi:MAG TPA: hypothetical protein GX506_01800 [Firmicutes bacterium]|nr:hypothetical protein [Bacillota bacterium]
MHVAFSTIQKLLFASILVSVIGLIQMATGLLIWNTAVKPGRWVILLARLVIITLIVYTILTARIAVEVFWHAIRPT